MGREWDREAKEKWVALSSLPAGAGTVAQMLDDYLSYMRSELSRGGMSARHVADRTQDAAKLKLFFGKMDKTKVKRDHVRLYLERRTTADGKPAPIRANREISLLSAAYNRDTSTDFNPCLGVPRNKEYARRRYVEGWELRRFAKRCCPPWLRGYIVLKYLTGLRMADMLGLCDSSATDRGLRVRVSKSRLGKVLEYRWTWALRRTVGFVRGTRSKHGRDLPNGAILPQELRWFNRTTSGIKSAWRRAQAQWIAIGGTPFREHDIRAKTGSDSRHVTEAQHRLGHTKSSTTARHYRRSIDKITPLK